MRRPRNLCKSAPELERRPRSRPLGRRTAIRFALLAVLVVLAVPVAAQAARATSIQRFTFSGAVTGTVKGNCGGQAAGYGANLTIYGSLKGSPSKDWILNVNTPTGGKKGGTFTDFKRGANGLAPASIVLQAETSSKLYDWISLTGKVTTTSNSGRIDVTFGPYVGAASGVPGKGTIRLNGTWSCNT